MSFQPFYFEGNQAWGLIDSVAEWHRITQAYQAEWGGDTIGQQLMRKALATRQTAEILKGQHQTANQVPVFGLRIEHSSTTTLESWARKNNMYDVLIDV